MRVSVLYRRDVGCWRCGIVFCKQKTAYEMRISDWSSDVCSSDLIGQFDQLLLVEMGHQPSEQRIRRPPVIEGDAIGIGQHGAFDGIEQKIGRASCRERVCQYV